MKTTMKTGLATLVTVAQPKFQKNAFVISPGKHLEAITRQLFLLPCKTHFINRKF